MRKVYTHQGDEVSEGQLDLNLHLVLWMDHGSNILVVGFEQIPDQLWLLITVNYMKSEVNSVSLGSNMLKITVNAGPILMAGGGAGLYLSSTWSRVWLLHLNILNHQSLFQFGKKVGDHITPQYFIGFCYLYKCIFIVILISSGKKIDFIFVSISFWITLIIWVFFIHSVVSKPFVNLQ